MKSAKPPAAQGSSSRRSQPSRQARTNPSRHSHVRGSLGGRDNVAGSAASDQPIDIFPAITHFADAITALPKELVRHITLLKEVDAKIYAPEDALFQLVDSAMRAPPAQTRPTTDAPENVALASAPMSAQNSSNGVATTGDPTAAPSMNGSQASAVVDSGSDLRRQLYQQTAFKIQEMLGSLEEKNHVISTANDALQKQLTRIEEVWPHVEGEFSDEAKWGSTTHWAYPENRAGNKAAHAERSRREGAAAISAAAQQLAEEAAARSDARKQAVQAKRNQKTQQQESDFDDPEGRGGKGEPANATNSTSTTKKGGSKARKAAADVGLGISTNSTSNGSAPQPKRRKVEKVAAGNAPVERVMASASGTDVPKAKTSSPRGTPAPEGQKKRKALPSGSTQPKKRNGASAKPPSAASSPVVGSLPDPKQPRASPAPSQTKAPTASRARQNSVKSTADNIMRPSSSASNKPNGAAPATPELPPATGWTRPSGEHKAADITAVIKTETAKKETMDAGEVGVIVNASANNRKETPKQEEVERQSEPVAQTATAPTVTKSGRASKPSTPALATFQEAARSRSARNSESKEPSGKRKKGGNNGNNNGSSSNSNNGGNGGNGASSNANNSNSHSSNIAGLAMAVHGAASRLGDEDMASSAQGDEEGEIDADEPVYCYCNGVSYGEMVACDADDCEREWFHLECVGLKVAPKGNAKWYCEPCKKRLTASGKKINGR